MWAEMRPHEWLGGGLRVLGLAPWPLFNPHLSDLTKGVKGNPPLRDIQEIKAKSHIINNTLRYNTNIILLFHFFQTM